ncbi:elongin C [Diaporthe eres]
MLRTSVDPDKHFKENRETVVNLPEMSAVVLEKVVEYLLYWYRYQDKEDVPDMEIPVDMCLELLTAADYLQMDSEHMLQPSSKRA